MSGALHPPIGRGAAAQPRPLLVLICGKSPLRRRGGLESYARAHALAGARLGFDTRVVCLGTRSAVIRTDFGLLHEVASPVRPLATWNAALHSVPMTRAVVALLAGVAPPRPTIVHGLGAWSQVAVAVARRLARWPVPVVPVSSAFTTQVHEHAGMLRGLRRDDQGAGYIAHIWGRYLFAHAIGTRAERRGYEGARVVLVNYESVRALLTAQFGRGLPIRHIPYASDLAFRAPAPAPPPDAIARLRPAGAPVVLCVSRHDPRKGVDVLLRALAGLAAAGVAFRACLVGPGTLLAANRALLARLGLGDRVAITGQVPDIAPYFQHADVFVLPSLEEGSGSLSLLEALQNGLPIVASGCDGIPEDVVADPGPEAGAPPASAALLVEPSDTRALEHALARVLGDPQLRARLGRDARRIHEQRFSADAFTAALGSVYAELGVRGCDASALPTIATSSRS